MPWILGLIGAIFGAGLAEGSDGMFGLVAGALIGALGGALIHLRTRVSDLEVALQLRDERERVMARQDRTTGAGKPAAPSAAAQAAAPALETARPGAPVAPIPPASTTASTPGMAHAQSTSEPATDKAAGTAPPAQASPAPPPRPAAAVASAPVIRSAPPTPRPAPVPSEPGTIEKIGAILKSWLFEGNVPVKLGVVILFLGIGYGLKYAIQQEMLVIPTEVYFAMVAAVALAALFFGWLERQRRAVFGLSLQGGAIGALLLIVFAAFKGYELLPAGAAFALIVILVAGAALLALLQNAPVLAVMGFIGGYLAPVLISTGSGNHIALFSYYAVLNAAVFGIAWKRPWRWLNLIGFGFTFVVGLAWGREYYRPDLFNTVEPFLILFFLFYIAIPVLYALRQPAERRGYVDGTLAFGTPLLAFPLQVALLRDNDMALAFSALAVAAIYGALTWWLLRREKLTLLGQSFGALALGFATLAVPLALSARWTSAVWALQGAGLIWIGVRQNSRLREYSGFVLTLLAAGAYVVALGKEDWDHDFFVHGFVDGWRLLGGHTLSLLLLAIGGWIAARTYEARRRDSAASTIAWLWLLPWWVLAVWVAMPSRWSGLFLALNGALLAWIALRRNSTVREFVALALTVLAGLAYAVILIAEAFRSSSWSRVEGELAIANAHTATLIVMALAAWFISRLYDRRGAGRIIVFPTFVWALGWWSLAGIREADNGIGGLEFATALTAFTALSMALAAGLRSIVDWPRLGWIVVLTCLLGVPLAFFVDSADGGIFVMPQGAIWLAWLFAAGMGLWRLREPVQRAISLAHLGSLFTLASLLGLYAIRLTDDQLAMGEGWQIAASFLPLAVLFWGCWRAPGMFALPLSDMFARYATRWFVLAGAVLGLVWFFSQFSAGGATPLDFVPLLNPLELFQLLLLALFARYVSAGGARLPGWLIGLAGFFMLTMFTLRGAFHLSVQRPDMVYDWITLALDSQVAQTALTVVWSISGVLAWIYGSTRLNRRVWLAGAILMAVVMAKLVLLDRTYTGDLAGVVSFIAVGLLMVVVGYIAPSPPKTAESNA